MFYLADPICFPILLSLTAFVTVRIFMLGKPFLPRNTDAFASYSSYVFRIPEGVC
jgi:hypothetical protein